MANMRMTLETILEEHRKVKATLERIRSRSAELTPEGMKAELERSLAPHRANVEKVTAHLDAVEKDAQAELEALEAESLSMPKVNATELVAAELEARRVMERAPLELAGVLALVGPHHESVSLPARVIVLEEAVAREVVDRDTLAAQLFHVSPLAAAAAEKARAVREVLNNVHRPVLSVVASVVNDLRTDRVELHVNYPGLLDKMLGSYSVDADYVAGVPSLRL